MLNRKQFSRKLAESYMGEQLTLKAKVTYELADQMVRKVFDFLGKVIYEEGEDVMISGFGTFKHKTAKPKNVRHPGTGEIITQPERDFVKFTPSELLDNKDN